MAILITGGAGYIGSHTIVELKKRKYDNLLSVDNFSNSTPQSYNRIKKVVGEDINQLNIDLADNQMVRELFKKYAIEGVIHFAALKSVPESVEKPLEYYANNINSLINLLDCCKEFEVNKFIFSSSCSVYGNPNELPVTEETPFGKAESPYAYTKQIGENILKDFCKAHINFKALSLRYFNPAGADESGLMGEIRTESPNSLVPILAQQAIGIRNSFEVFGTDYNTIDGSCIRDYIHVSDIAEAHVIAFEHLSTMKSNYDVFNLGSGKGNTTLEVVKAFEKENKVKLNYSLSGRRNGDVEAIFANNDKAKNLLHWTPKYQLEDIVSSAWKWQKNADQ